MFQHDRHGLNDQTQLREIDKRRTEVSIRYQQRLEYLKARLKGAEIHERLLRK